MSASDCTDPSNLPLACEQQRRTLLAGAADADAPDARLFATLIAARGGRGELAPLGLSQAQFAALLARHFPRLQPAAIAAPPARIVLWNSVHADFVATLSALLLRDASRAVRRDDAECVAAIIAHACLRPDHLWRDLGLDGRDAVSGMLARYFPALAARNVAHLRWKKFLAREIAADLGVPPAPAPGCPGCDDYAHCFPRTQ
ncbi:hydrogenase [Burkholderia ubonensis]|uniref:nitrogen fixation protein NifQ n=1 Tax=Burkholderia ubonensis TaxID=101571 RepID=UPI00075612BA|nr:nitrogen fixation protein NifQ [Burkholderia ubonensis]KVV39367.1 hydrogenase [Burkholderia ubonensis]